MARDRSDCSGQGGVFLLVLSNAHAPRAQRGINLLWHAVNPCGLKQQRHQTWADSLYNPRGDPEETSRLATTIDTWWPAVLVALTEDVTNARTEGFNRIIKQTKRVGCGFTNMDNYRRRIMVHIALTRGQRPAA